MTESDRLPDDELFASAAAVETRFADGFAFDNRADPLRGFTKVRNHFKKNFFGGVGEMKSLGEEF